MTEYSLVEKAKLLSNHYLLKIFSTKNNRGYEAAKGGRLVSDWASIGASADYEIKSSLKTLRARSRDLSINNDYARRFLTLLDTNVIGPSGIKLQVRAVDVGSDGSETLDTNGNNQVENAWRAWTKKGNCTVDKQLSFVDLQRLLIKGLARDGEVLIRKVNNFDNAHKFALQIVEPDYLDEQYSDTAPNGDKIKLGIEYNQWSEPTAYYLYNQHPGENIFYNMGTVKTRVEKDSLYHLYVMERPGQSRGVPWMATAMKRLKMLSGYEESELVAARVGASKMGFFTRQDNNYPFDDKDDKGNLIDEVSPGQFKQLPAGYDFKPFDIDHPSSAYENFHTSILRGISSSFGVSYNSLSGNLTNANYSSMRHGALDERDFYMCLQAWVTENFLQPVYEDWLKIQMINQLVNLPMRRFEKFSRTRWQPRRWAWIDPLKDIQASVTAVQNGLKSRHDVISESGGDLIDTFEQLKTEQDLAADLELNLASENEVTENETEEN